MPSVSLLPFRCVSGFVAFFALFTCVAGQDDVGPLVGHVDSNSAHLLIRRGAVERRLRLHLSSDGAQNVQPVEVISTASHVSVFDSKTMTLCLNGKQVVVHRLPTSGPASEFGGLIIGGHRAGVGRDFGGLIDEAGLWARILDDKEIVQLFQQGMPSR